VITGVLKSGREVEVDQRDDIDREGVQSMRGPPPIAGFAGGSRNM
jgi:hypothetical protein